MEILVGPDRRRRWRAKEKLRIVAETEQPGASFAAVARRHEISRDLLWNWRQEVRRGALAPAPMPVFVPVRITPDPVVSVPVPLPSPASVLPPAEDSRVEITLPDGTCVRVGADVGLPKQHRMLWRTMLFKTAQLSAVSLRRRWRGKESKYRHAT